MFVALFVVWAGQVRGAPRDWLVIGLLGRPGGIPGYRVTAPQVSLEIML
jgi:hypothetical protein